MNREAEHHRIEDLREGLRPFVEATPEDVPEEMVTGMWAAVEPLLGGFEVPSPAPRGLTPGSAPRGRRWWAAPRLVPALFATAAVLLIGLALLAGQVRDLQNRERRLSAQLDRQEHLIQDLRLRGGSRPAGREAREPGWAELALLTRGGETTVGELLRLLDELPPQRELLTPEAARTLMRRVTAAVGETVAGGLPAIETADGLQAGEAVRLLAAFPLDPEQKLSRTRLHVMSRGLGL